MSIPKQAFITSVDDPKKQGRVKLHIPSLDGTNSKQETPWQNMAKSPEGFGADSRSPPQVGTPILALVDDVNPSIRLVVAGLSSSELVSDPNIAGGQSLAGMRDYFENIVNKLIAGVPKWTQKLRSLSDRGSDESEPPVVQAEETYEPSIAERRELPTSIPANPQMIQLPPPVKNVVTALTADASSFTAAMANALPGIPFDLSKIFDHVQGELLDQLKATVKPEIMTALGNISKLSSVFTPENVNGFLQDANFVNPSTFASKMVEELKGTENVGQLFEKLNKILTDDTIKDLSSLADVSMESLSAFGAIPQLLKADGTLEDLASDLIDKAKELFSGLVSGIPILGGADQFLKNSQIPNELIQRMKAVNGKELKEMLEKVAGQNNPARVLVESVIENGLKPKLEQ